ncbi:MAG TPA: rod shape-determining protein MreB [Verrucomicrobiae bacterium]|nr:rod shape-determining protein MreB [Verrucomicrobiae bacterium]
MFGFGIDLGIDLGTATVLVYVKGKGIVLNEPSVVAIDKNTDKIIAVGEEARAMLGRTPGNIVAIRPLRDGVIADYNTTERMLGYFIHKATGQDWFWRRWFSSPRVVVCIPSGVTEVEERAVKQAAAQAGAKSTIVVEEPYAAALGAGLDIAGPQGNMVVDIGGGTTDIAVISLGGIVCKKSLRVGGDKFDEAIVRFIRREHSVMIGDRTAEEIKINVGSALPEGRPSGDSVFEVRGRDLLSGLPKTIKVTSTEAYAALEEQVEAVISAVKEVLEKTPPELSADILNQGIVMTGGGGLLWGLDVRLSRETGLPVYVAEDAVSCVALGTGKVLEGTLSR